MRGSSPLRYPGGKAAMSGLLSQVRKLNGLGDRAIAEPFAGGAGASLSLLYLEDAPSVYINDADPAIHAFWWSVVNRPGAFQELLSKSPINMAEWRRQRDVYRDSGRVSRVRRGFAAFYLNRCNRSGIIVNGGPIGGIGQEGRWRLDARFNKLDLHRRCARIAEYRERIHVSGTDGLKFIRQLDAKSTFFFIDPPYFEKGPMLYLNALNDDYHSALADLLKATTNAGWVLTYDDCDRIRELYSDWATVRPFSLRYAAAERRRGTELLIAPLWMRLPKLQESTALEW